MQFSEDYELGLQTTHYSADHGTDRGTVWHVVGLVTVPGNKVTGPYTAQTKKHTHTDHDFSPLLHVQSKTRVFKR